MNLKPCPFCGEMPIDDGYSDYRNEDQKEYVCKKCDLWGIKEDWWNKRQSAWEMFRRLEQKYRSKENNWFVNNKFIQLLQKRCWSDGTTVLDTECGMYLMYKYSEQEAIEIMQEIEKELE